MVSKVFLSEFSESNIARLYCRYRECRIIPHTSDNDMGMLNSSLTDEFVEHMWNSTVPSLMHTLNEVNKIK